ncbi:PGF-pre-PGF domain-containing protein [Candidatus Woesearchaeota archaeon]|nr:PGF-pre-PGF domain-containing protein [Candidatus Woesearchaeota archaeon]
MDVFGCVARLAVFLAVCFAVIGSAYAIPLPLGVDGAVYDVDGFTKAGKVAFSVKNVVTGQEVRGFTRAGRYSVALSGNDGDSVVVSVWNIEHNSSRSVALSGVMHGVDLLLNLTIRNYAPVILSVPSLVAVQSQPYLYSVVAEDVNEDVLSFSLVQAPAGMSVDSSGRVSWVPSSSDVGAHLVSVSVNDSEYQAVQSFTLFVQDVNDAPVFVSVPLAEASVAHQYSYQAVGFDADGDALSFSLVFGPQGMSVGSSGIVSWVPSAQGVFPVGIMVSDGALNSSQLFSVSVGVSDFAPFFVSSPVLEAVEDKGYVYFVEASDPENASLVFSFEGPAGMSLEPVGMSGMSGWSGAVLRWLPGNSDVGVHNVSVSVSDGVNSVLQRFAVIVLPVNDAPVIFSAPGAVAFAGRRYSYQVSARDEDSPVLHYSLLQGPVGMSISGSGLVSWMPRRPGGRELVVVMVSDGLLSARQEFSVEVSSQREEVRAVAGNVSGQRGSGLSLDVDFLERSPVSPALDRKVYRYLSIQPVDGAHDRAAVVSFSVPKSWLGRNRVQAGRVVLKRFSGSWVSLPTRVVGQDNVSVGYEADTPGFSYFAIAAEEFSLPEPELSRLENPYRLTGIIHDAGGKALDVGYSIKNLNRSFEYSGVSRSGRFYAMVYGQEGDALVFSSGSSDYGFSLRGRPGSDLVLDFAVERSREGFGLVAALAASVLVAVGLFVGRGIVFAKRDR